jgi:hypothetical protein
MKFKLLTPVLISACIFISTSANAALITVGALTLEEAGDTYVKDSLNGLEWLRWDQVNGLTKADVDAEINSGDYNGWSIANNTQAYQFINAIFHGGASATCSDSNSYCGPIDLNSLRAAFGLVTVSTRNQHNYGYYLSDDGGSKGYIGDNTGNNALYKDTNTTSLSVAPNGSYMLVRESSSVPEPTTIAIFALGLLGLASRCFKKQARELKKTPGS